MPGGGRNITKKAIACSPVQADNGRNEQPKFSSTAGDRPVLSHRVTNSASLFPPRETPSVMISGYLVSHVCPKPQGADTV